MGYKGLEIVPITLRAANVFVKEHHRHHPQVRGCKFCLALLNDKELHGVVIAGRPLSRHLDDGFTLEITRLCTDGIKNGCSKLYSRTFKIGSLMGYKRVITYTLKSESGVSLRASGWTAVGSSRGLSWNSKGRPRSKHSLGPKVLWEKL